MKFKFDLFEVGTVAGKTFVFNSNDLISWENNVIRVERGGSPDRVTNFNSSNICYTYYENRQVIEE